MPARLVAALLLVSGVAAAQEKPPLLFISEVRQVEAFSDPVLGKAYALLGRVALEQRGVFAVRATRALVWLDPDADETVFRLFRDLKQGDGGVPLWAVRSIYAEGGPTPALFQVGGQIFRCSSFFYDFREQRGVFVDADLRMRRGPRRDHAPDLVLRAKELRLAPGSVVARDSLLFTSNDEAYEVGVTVREVRVDDPEMRRAVGELRRISARDYREGKGPTRKEVEAAIRDMEAAAMDLGPDLYTLKGMTVLAQGLPVFAWGEAEARGEDVMALRLEAELGSIGNLGFGGRLAGGLGLKPVGFLLGGGYIEEHGWFTDLALDVDAFEGRVRGKSYGVYLHDHGEEDGVAPETMNRFWTQNFYRWDISRVWRLDGEFAELSDPTFLGQWDEQVEKEGLPQETLLYLRGRTDHAYVTAIGNWRTIDFEDQVEELPSIGGFVPVVTLLRLGEDARGRPVALQVSVPASVSNLNHVQGRGAPLPDFGSWRATLDPTFTIAFPLGPLRIVPFVTPGVTAYENDLAGDATARTTVAAGVRADTQLSRWFGRVRHVVNLTLSYEDLFHASEEASDLFPFDAVDQVTPWNGVSGRFRNRFLRAAPDGLVEFLSFEILGTWFPGGEQPLGGSGDWFLDWKLWWQATRTFTLGSRGDIEDGSLSTASLEGWWQARSRLGLGASIRHLDDTSNMISVGTEYEVSTRWSLVGYSQYDAQAGEWNDQGLLVRRLGKSGVVGLRITWDPGDDGFGFSFTFDVLERYRERQRRQDTLRALVGWN